VVEGGEAPMKEKVENSRRKIAGSVFLYLFSKSPAVIEG
jgi:hypothetical protein